MEAGDRAAPLSRALRGALVLAVVSGSIGLAAAEPDTPGPPCTFRSITSLYCPGCGSFRSLRAIAHGQPLEAFTWNVMVVLYFPLALWYVLSSAAVALRGRPLGGYAPSARLVRVLVAVLVFFWIARNISLWPFSLLAPGGLAG